MRRSGSSGSFPEYACRVSPAEETQAAAPIEGRVELTEADFVEAWLGYAMRRHHVQTTWKLIAIVLVISLAALVSAWPVMPGVWTAMILALLAGVYLVKYQWVWIGKRSFARLHDARRRFKVSISEAGMHARGPKAEVRYAWSTLTAWIETAHLFVMLGPQGISDLCPKRSFDPADLPALRALFDARIVTPPAVTTQAKATRSLSWKTLVLWLVLVAAFFAIYQLVQTP